MTPPSNFALRIIVKEDPKLVRTHNARYADAAADRGLEAVEKGALLMCLPATSQTNMASLRRYRFRMAVLGGPPAIAKLRRPV